MNLHNAVFLLSAAGKNQYPDAIYPEIAFAGRSNVGKSSFINKLLNRKALARTSSKPGKTTLLNYYTIDDALYFVDLPGYGYAQVSKSEKLRWGKMIDEYLAERDSLSATFLIVDSRHKPTQDDIQMLGWIKHRHQKAVVIATKIDKLKKLQVIENLAMISEVLGLTQEDDLIPFSAQTGLGREEAWQTICRICGTDMPSLTT